MASLILITGREGLLARSVLASLPRSRSVIALGRRDVDLLRASAGVELVRELRPDALLHLAWCSNSSDDYRDSPDNEVWASRSIELAEECFRIGAHFYGAGSILESHTEADAYSRSKAATRDALQPRIESGDATWLRPHFVFDPVAGRPRVLRAALAAVRSDQTLQLRSPHSLHDFIHAADVGTAIVAAIEAQLTGIIDIGSGMARTVASLVEAVGARWELDPRAIDSPGEDSPPAEVDELKAVGWEPRRTKEFFNEPRAPVTG